MSHINKIDISVIVPCYNQAEYLSEALESVLKQTHDNWECIIVNDGSPDNTEEVAKDWLAKDKRFKYVNKDNNGLSSARNSGIEIATGEFILPLDADDKIAPDYLKLAVEVFENDPSLKVVYCRAEKFGIENGLWDLNSFSLKNLARRNMIFCSAVYKKTDWELVAGYDINLKYGWEDWELWIAILKNGGKVKMIDSVEFYYRIKKISMIKSLNKEKMEKLYMYLSVKHADFFVKQFGTFHSLVNQIKVEQNNVDLLKKKYSSIDFIYRIKRKLGL